jgi:hypothetical protein
MALRRTQSGKRKDYESPICRGKMRCSSCGESAGFLKRVCEECSRVFAIYQQHRGALGLSQLLDLFIAAGIPRAKVEAALASDLDGGGALQDRITADMANGLLAAMGLRRRHTPADVKRLRESGGGGASTARPGGDAGPPKNHR